MTIQTSPQPHDPTSAAQHLPVFVYGTLRTGQGNYAWALAGRTTHEQTATLPNAIMFDNGGFPFVVDYDPDNANFTDGEFTVSGDLMWIDPAYYDEVMVNLDRLEGYTPGSRWNMYDRKVVTVTTADGQQITANTYVAAQGSMDRVSRLPVIPDGNWLTRSNTRRR